MDQSNSQRLVVKTKELPPTQNQKRIVFDPNGSTSSQPRPPREGERERVGVSVIGAHRSVSGFNQMGYFGCSDQVLKQRRRR